MGTYTEIWRGMKAGYGCRLEEMNEKRQGMVQRLKLVERERDSLEGARAAAEAYMAKEQECVKTQCLIYEVRDICQLLRFREDESSSRCTTAAVFGEDAVGARSLCWRRCTCATASATSA